MFKKTIEASYSMKDEQNADTVVDGVVSGDVVSAEIEIELYSSIDEVDATVALALVNRQKETDARNALRVKTQASNEHAPSREVSEEEKAKRSAEAKKNRKMITWLKEHPEALPDSLK